MAEKLKNKDYDLISVIYNASQAAETCTQYMRDAEKEKDQEAKQFFNEVLDTNAELVQRGKQLLKNRLQ
jgi:hypothetical protein